MSEQAAFDAFLRLRYPPDGVPACPLGCSARTYAITTRRTFKCAGCLKQFSPTTGTSFARRKVSYSTIMETRNMIDSGLSASAITRRLGCQYNTGWLLAQRWLAEISANGELSPPPEPTHD